MSVFSPIHGNAEIAAARRLLLELASQQWRAHAACKGLTDVFYPVPTDMSAVRAAVEICDGCPVKDDCYEHAIKNGERYGIWGGQSARKRRDEMARRGREARRMRKPATRAQA